MAKKKRPAPKPLPRLERQSSRSGSMATRKAPARAAQRPRSSTRSPRATQPTVSPLVRWWSGLSAERKIDILGIGLALIGFLSFLSLLSKEHGVFTRWWVTAMRQAGGTGALILPVGVLLLGLWLILRKIERIPAPSGERVTGLILLYINILTILHILSGGGWPLAADGLGGGYIGALFERVLVGGLGMSGAWVLLAAWFLISVILSLDISISDLVSFFTKLVNSLSDRVRAERELTAHQPSQERRYQPALRDDDEEEEGSRELPPDFIPMPGVQAARSSSASRSREAADRARARSGQPAAKQGERESHPAAAAQQSAATASGLAWVLPKVEDMLDAPTLETVKSNVEQERGRLIEETLASFGAPAHVVEVSHGPTVTQYGVEPDFLETRTGRMRVRVSKIVSLADDLALALAAQRIRIQAPVPGRSFVGIEVPNIEISRVMLREVFESDPFQKIRTKLGFALGKDVGGKSIAYDLTAMPHLLIAGTTGSGKSVCVNSLLIALLMQNTPNDLRMILVDPKRVELTGYNGIPHLLAPVVVDAERVVGALQWVQREMDARYHRFSQVGARNIAEYNRKNSPTLPYLLVLVDELADLMMLAPEETERSLTRLAQLARATGIHLVLATQRPSVDVVTGLIKANFPARVAFAVASGVDSRVILDQPGAERLLGRGDMLFQAPDAAAPVRIQGVWISEPEIQRVVDYWKNQEYNLRTAREIRQTDGTAEPVNMDLPLSTPLTQAPLFDEEMGSKNDDPILEQAIKVVHQEGRASISMLQRKLRIGYTRAARLIDAMEDQGIVGPAQATSQVREILDQ